MICPRAGARTSAETVRFFTAEEAPPQWITGAREEGWYWRDGGDWSGPCPGGEPEARHHAELAAGSR